MKQLLIVIGWVLCIPAIILGPIARLLPIDTKRPWVDGLLINTLRAYKKYDTTSWVRRMKSIYKEPQLTIQYLRLLRRKMEVEFDGYYLFPVGLLSAGHSVQTDHEHHRKRVEDLRRGKTVISNYGSPIVVGSLVHDGNHRLAACREAGVTFMEVAMWRKK